MASLASLDWPRLLTAEEFFQIDFGPDLKAELDNGVIRMMAGGTRGHSQTQARLIRIFGNLLENSSCEPHGSDMAIQTRENGVRYPDVTIDCGSPGDDVDDTRLTNPRVVIEILSPSTREYDLLVKSAEYRVITSIDTVVFVDLEARSSIVHQRIPGGWTEMLLQGDDLFLPAVNLTLSDADIFGVA